MCAIVLVRSPDCGHCAWRRRGRHRRGGPPLRRAIAAVAENWATPMEMVMVPSTSPVDFFTSFLALHRRRIWSATMGGGVQLGAAQQDGEFLAAIARRGVAALDVLRQACATRRSTWSPVWWPQLSLNFLKWSMSHISSADVLAFGHGGHAPASTASSNALRLAMLVRGSVRLSLRTSSSLSRSSVTCCGGCLQFAFQALGALFHGAGGGDQAVHQLAQVGGAALAAQFAGGGGQRVCDSRRCRGRRASSLPSTSSITAAMSLPSASMVKAARAPDRQRRRRSCSSSAVKGFLASMIARHHLGDGRDFRPRHRRRTVRNCRAWTRRRTRPSGRARSWQKPVRDPV